MDVSAIWAGVQNRILLVLTVLALSAGLVQGAYSPETSAHPGNTDCSGLVDSVDALNVLRYAAGIAPQAGCIDAGDVTCDGTIDMIDSLAILRELAGMPLWQASSACWLATPTPPSSAIPSPTTAQIPASSATPSPTPAQTPAITPQPTQEPPGLPGEFSVVVPVYNNAGLEHTLTTLGPYIRDGDTFVVISGNFNKPINTGWMNDAAQTLKAEYPETTILAGSSGLGNIALAAAAVAQPIEGIVYIYEPDFPNEPEFTWDFETTLSLFDQVAQMTRANGLRAIGKPTGRPLLQLAQQQYGWDYQLLGQRVDEMFIQTQTYCKKNPEAYDGAIDALLAQYDGAETQNAWVPQVTIDIGAPNGVTVSQAFECVNAARRKGVSGILMWWSPSYSDEAVEFLGLLNR